MVSKKNRRQVVKEMFDAVEAGESYTILKGGKPAAIVLPWADWQALQGAWLDLLGFPMRTVQGPRAETLPPEGTPTPAERRNQTMAVRGPVQVSAPLRSGVYAEGPGPRLMSREEAEAMRAERIRQGDATAAVHTHRPATNVSFVPSEELNIRRTRPEWMDAERDAIRQRVSGGEGSLSPTVALVGPAAGGPEASVDLGNIPAHFDIMRASADRDVDIEGTLTAMEGIDDAQR